MTDPDAKANLVRYLREARESLLGKLDGLSEYDMRRPLVPTGTNLLGLVKHVAVVTAAYFGEVFDRPFPRPLLSLTEGAEPNADMWAGDNVHEADEAWWAAYRDRLEATARSFA
ncbi:DUF664 domain-containing protein [Actinoplanes lobatus]|nr:DUF664 domain-containing protein [Actinoplanes lobatus]MBB4751729.1 hypothetical protein [Actinoplanes lobatus]